MKNFLTTAAFVFALAGTITSCKKEAATEMDKSISLEEKSMVKAAGFNSNWFEKTDEGDYLIEGDIQLTADELKDMAGKTPTNNIVVANEEHYRTYNVVSTPSTGFRTITIRLASGFPAHYSTGLNQAITRYNSYNLKIRFLRVSTGGNIVITGQNLGTSGGSCILGRAAGFPTNAGNPSSGFVLSTNKCATGYLNTANKVDEVIAHEIGHCIGFRHTDYATRASCGPTAPEPINPYGAVYIPGTPGLVSGSYNSWMMACINGSNSFGAADITALNYVY